MEQAIIIYMPAITLPSPQSQPQPPSGRTTHRYVLSPVCTPAWSLFRETHFAFTTLGRKLPQPVLSRRGKRCTERDFPEVTQQVKKSTGLQFGICSIDGCNKCVLVEFVELHCNLTLNFLLLSLCCLIWRMKSDNSHFQDGQNKKW